MTTRNRATARLMTVTGIGMIVLAMTLTGCTGNDQGQDSASDVLDSKQTKMADCMRDKGFEHREPTGDGAQVTVPDGVDQDEYLAAMGECAKQAGVEGTAAAPAQSDEKFFRKLEKQAACLRENGFPDFPDPDRSGKDPGWQPDDDAAFTAASDKCDAEAGIHGMSTDDVDVSTEGDR